MTLFFINWEISLSAFLLFGLAYLFISSRSKLKLINNGKIIAFMTKERVKSIQEALGSIRDMLLSNKQKKVLKILI